MLPLERLSTAQAVSAMYVGVSVGGILASLMLPVIVARLDVRGTSYLAAGASCVASVVLPRAELWLFLLGMVLFVAGATAFEVSLSLYTMNLVPRKSLARFEPLHVLLSAASYCVGDWLGAYLGGTFASWVPYALTLAVVCVTIIYYHLLGLAKVKVDRAGTGSNPLRHARRFIRQPRLRSAWLIAFSRSAWSRVSSSMRRFFCVGWIRQDHGRFDRIARRLDGANGNVMGQSGSADRFMPIVDWRIYCRRASQYRHCYRVGGPCSARWHNGVCMRHARRVSVVLETARSFGL